MAAYELATNNYNELWETTLGAGTSSSPLVVDDTPYIGANDDVLYALDIAVVGERWRFAVGEGSDYTWGPSPSFADDVIFFPLGQREERHGPLRHRRRQRRAGPHPDRHLDAGASRQLFENLFANEDSLPTGRYELELCVDSTPVRRDQVVIG